MKIQLTIELEMPDDTSTQLAATNEELSQLLFDTYVNYVTVSHMSDAVEWCAKGKIGSDDEDARAKAIYQHHKLWGKICRDAKWSFKEIE